MRFTKMHGIGNDFVIVEPARTGETDWPALARATADRHFGIGHDGLILVRPSPSCDWRMQMYNPDGSEADMCGNGIRCFAKYLYDTGLTQQTEIAVETLSGVQHLHLEIAGDQVASVTVNMGIPRLHPAEVPVTLPGDGPILDHPLNLGDVNLAITPVNTGNPHAVAFLETPVADFPLARIGPLVEHHPLFPRRTNFHIVNRGRPGHLIMRSWERGAGLTLACGTGACAVTVVARLHGWIGDQATVTLPGGNLEISWDSQGAIYLTGPAKTVFTGDWLG